MIYVVISHVKQSLYDLCAIHVWTQLNTSLSCCSNDKQVNEFCDSQCVTMVFHWYNIISVGYQERNAPSAVQFVDYYQYYSNKFNIWL